MKIRTSITILLFSIAAVNCCSQTVEGEVYSENGKELSGIPLSVWYVGITGRDDVEVEAITNDKGKFKSKGNALNSIAVIIEANGWYKYRQENLSPGIDHKVKATLRRIIAPCPLIVRQVKLKIPTFQKDLQFDLEKGDWLPPHGKGVAGDFLITFNRDFKGMKYTGERLRRAREMSKRGAASRNEDWTEDIFKLRSGKWDAEVTLSIAGLGGFGPEVKNLLPYSEMKMPHTAPEHGFTHSLNLTGSTYKQVQEKSETGYFFQSRVVVDDDNKIVSANYGKIDGEIKIDAKGEMTFLYYYNPRPNDRNLEFDPGQNLAIDQDQLFSP